MNVERKSRAMIVAADHTVLCTNLLTPPPRLTPTGKISHAKTRVYTQRYRKVWEQMPDFKGWLTSVPFQQTRAYCLYCKKNLHAHRLSLLKHTCTMKHQRAALAYEAEEKKKVLESDASEIGFIEEVESMNDQLETREENEEDIEYIVERLETDDDEDMIETEEAKEEIVELPEEGEEGEKDLSNDLCTEELPSEDEDTKVIKKIKLMHEEKCRDTLAEAMAHVHSEYLEEEVGDHEEGLWKKEMEIAMEPISTDENGKYDVIKTATLSMLDTDEYQTNLSSSPAENAINFVQVTPHLKTNQKTVTVTCGSKTFTLTGGTFQPGTQYILTKLKGKSATLIMADQKKPVANDSDKDKLQELTNSSNLNQSIIAASNEPIMNSDQQTDIKGFSHKKIAVRKLPAKSNALKKLRISTYVLDNTRGVPISGLQVSLYKLMDGKWTFLNESTTNMNGFCIDLVEKINCTTGRYKLHFDVDKYFTLRRIETILPFVEVVFDVKNPNNHYNLPLLLSPFSYTIYRST